MSAKEHYEHHLGNLYSWMAGEFRQKQAEQQAFFSAHNIFPSLSKKAIDLGCGHGLQSVSLAQLGFSVTSVDFNRQLLAELEANNKGSNIRIVEDELIHYLQKINDHVELIVCMGDTLTHLESVSHIRGLFSLVSSRLEREGKFVVSFRDLTRELAGGQRFIPVKSDDTRILTCFLEYFPDHVMVHDQLYEKVNSQWKQTVSAYPKLRLNESTVSTMIEAAGMRIVSSEVVNGMVTIVAKKKHVKMETLPLSFRPAHEDDLPFLWTLRQLTMKPLVDKSYGWKEQDQKFYAGDHLAFTRIFSANGQDIGVIKVLEQNGELFLSQLQVLPSWWGQGIGHQLLTDLCKRADAEQKVIRLQVIKENPALRLYLKFGFKLSANVGDHQFEMVRDPNSIA